MSAACPSLRRLTPDGTMEHMSSPTTERSPGEFPKMSQHADEPHSDSLNGLLNRLRAAVLGANDGIVSVAGDRDGLRRGDRRPAADLPRRRGGPGRRAR